MQRRMEIGKAIELLKLLAKPNHAYENQDDRDAIKMGIKALRLLAYEKSHRLDDLSLKLLLDAERS